MYYHLLTLQEALDEDRCDNPEYMTDEELEAALQSRGIQPSGSKEDMIKQLSKPAHSEFIN